MLTAQRLYKTRVWVDFFEHDLKSIDCSSTAFDVAVFLSGHRRYLKTKKQHVAFKTLRPRSYTHTHILCKHTLTRAKNIVRHACATTKDHSLRNPVVMDVKQRNKTFLFDGQTFIRKRFRKCNDPDGFFTRQHKGTEPNDRSSELTTTSARRTSRRNGYRDYCGTSDRVFRRTEIAYDLVWNA